MAVVLQVQQVDDVLHLAAEGEFLAAHRGQEERLRQEAGAALHMLADEQVAQDCLFLEEFGVLEGAGYAQFGNAVAGQGADVLALQVDAALIRVIDAADDIEEGGLAGAIGADDAEDLAGFHREADAGQRLDAAESEGQVPCFQEGAHRNLSVRR